MSKTQPAHSGNDLFKEPAADAEILRTRRAMIVPFMITILLGAMHVGFSMSSANQLAALFNAKYGWTTDSEKSIH